MNVTRGLPATVDVDVENLMDIVRADAQPPSVLLSVDHIDAESVPTTMWGLFIEPQGGEAEFVGAMPLFGLMEAKKADAEHGLSYTFDVTDAVMSMLTEGRMDPTRVTLSFRPINDIVDGDDAPVSVGTIAVLVQ
jgi:tyrosinase